MKARKLNRRISFWVTGEITDGFSGVKTTESILLNAWAMIEEIKEPKRYLDMGFGDLENSCTMIVRRRPGFDFNADNIFVKFKGNRWTVQHVMDIDISMSFIKLLVKKERITNTIALPPGGGFPFTFQT